VEIVLATHGFAFVGGSETYVLTVGDALQRLGHEVTIHAAEGGPMSEHAERRGLRLSLAEETLPKSCDAILVQDAGMAYALADRWPSTPQVFRACSDIHDFQLPPQLSGVVRSVVVATDRMARHVASLAQRHELVRLRHPVDTDRFRPRGEIRRRPRRAVLLGNYLTGRRRKLIEEAWGAHGVECVTIGAHGTQQVEPQAEIGRADIVVGKSRAILDGMSCGRAAYVLDVAGGDGWVTPELYPAMEADGFAGQATDWALTPERLHEDLALYRPEMGAANRDLVLAHHDARDHAHALVTLYRSFHKAPKPPGDAPLPELARLVRLQWAWEREAAGARAALAREIEHARALEEHARELEAYARALEEHLEELKAAVSHLERELAVRDADAADLRRQLLTQRVQAGLLLGRLVDRLRFR
jgi:hypothetical protein